MVGLAAARRGFIFYHPTRVCRNHNCIFIWFRLLSLASFVYGLILYQQGYHMYRPMGSSVWPISAHVCWTNTNIDKSRGPSPTHHAHARILHLKHTPEGSNSYQSQWQIGHWSSPVWRLLRIAEAIHTSTPKICHPTMHYLYNPFLSGPQERIIFHALARIHVIDPWSHLLEWAMLAGTPHPFD